jgi:hypothetical protein
MNICLKCNNELIQDDAVYGLHRHCFDQSFGTDKNTEFKDLDPKKSSNTSSGSHPNICLFDTLIGNNDRHGRNLGIIVTSSLKKLAPMYDNPSCLGIEDDFFLVSDINPSGSIWTKESKHPKPTDYIKELQRLGYGDLVSAFIAKVISQSSNIITAVQNANLSQKRKNALINLLNKRIEEFNHAKEF